MKLDLFCLTVDDAARNHSGTNLTAGEINLFHPVSSCLCVLGVTSLNFKSLKLRTLFGFLSMMIG